ncbi:glutaredoxin 3 [Pseudochelatococcus sp. G4_1912]|uniref:glutaredoxin 3 n=1 Tax=Pseudochelatococcus sp. G4_1912 TaxID=3114288 RepID=UPI0039C5B450
MPNITIYTKSYCPYCKKAKALLSSKGAVFVEIDITDDPAQRAAMIERANGRTTVPQIFFGDRHIGGFDDMNALDMRGELDDLLRTAT